MGPRGLKRDYGIFGMGKLDRWMEKFLEALFSPRPLARLVIRLECFLMRLLTEATYGGKPDSAKVGNGLLNMDGRTDRCKRTVSISPRSAAGIPPLLAWQRQLLSILFPPPSSLPLSIIYVSKGSGLSVGCVVRCVRRKLADRKKIL